MTQPLNFTPKAIADLTALAAEGRMNTPATSAGILYLVEKLCQAQVFVLSDSGELLDRSRPRPELPGVVLRPPFPVVALEYAANPSQWDDPIYTSQKCSKRISLAWEHTHDLPPPIQAMLGRTLAAGVMIASIGFYDGLRRWMPVGIAMHVDYEASWLELKGGSAFREAMVASGRMTRSVAAARTLPGTPVPLTPEVIYTAARAHGSAQTFDMLCADLMDEASAYIDLCWALACKNVSTHHHAAPDKLNRQRIKAGKLPLYGYHVLELAGGTFGSGDSVGDGARSGPRAHLRRGHIRRLPGERVTWVNQTMVRGRGFVEKVYAA